MDHTVHESLEPCPCKDDADEKKLEPEKLLEDCWFFGNLLDRKTRMLRSFSDPSSNYSPDQISPGKSYEETYESIEKLPGQDKFKPSDLMRASSMSPSMDQNPRTKRSDPGARKSNRKTSSKNLLRAPSLPTTLEIEEFQDDEEMEFSMGKLIRQASLNYSDIRPPKAHGAKGLEKTRPRGLMNQLKTQKSLNDLKYLESQGFKDLGLDFDKKDLNTSVVSIIPGLQEHKRSEEDEEKDTMMRPYFSEAWRAQSSAPPPKWDGKRSTEDMKTQIKFWARAVASNVRQEC